MIPFVARPEPVHRNKFKVRYANIFSFEIVVSVDIFHILSADC
jgi:hypothetical protein